jgi:hypothetical protein
MNREQREWIETLFERLQRADADRWELSPSGDTLVWLPTEDVLEQRIQIRAYLGLFANAAAIRVGGADIDLTWRQCKRLHRIVRVVIEAKRRCQQREALTRAGAALRGTSGG